jgi:hypothetical protein
MTLVVAEEGGGEGGTAILPLASSIVQECRVEGFRVHLFYFSYLLKESD